MMSPVQELRMMQPTKPVMQSNPTQHVTPMPSVFPNINHHHHVYPAPPLKPMPVKFEVGQVHRPHQEETRTIVPSIARSIVPSIPRSIVQPIQRTVMQPRPRAIVQPNPMADHVTLSFAKHHEFSSRYMRNNKGGGMKNLRCFPRCSMEHQDKGFCGTNISLKMQISRSIQSSRRALPETVRCYSEFVRVQDEEKPVMVPGQTRYSLMEMKHMERTPKTPIKSWFRGLLCDDASSVSQSPADWGDVLEGQPEEEDDGFTSSSTSCSSLEGRPQDSNSPTKLAQQAAAKRAHQAAAANHQVDLSFNTEHRAWHYGWNSNKHTCRDDHVMRVYVFVAESAYRNTVAEDSDMALPPATNALNSRDGTPMYVLAQVVESSSFSIYCKKREKKTPKTRLLAAMKNDTSLSKEATARLLAAVSDKQRAGVTDKDADAGAAADVVAYLAMSRERIKQARRDKKLALQAEASLIKKRKAQEMKLMRVPKKPRVVAAERTLTSMSNKRRRKQKQQEENGRTAVDLVDELGRIDNATYRDVSKLRKGTMKSMKMDKKDRCKDQTAAMSVQLDTDSKTINMSSVFLAVFDGSEMTNSFISNTTSGLMSQNATTPFVASCYRQGLGESKDVPVCMSPTSSRQAIYYGWAVDRSPEEVVE